MGYYSEALQEMNENTVQYMIEKQQDRLEEQQDRLRLWKEMLQYPKRQRQIRV